MTKYVQILQQDKFKVMYKQQGINYIGLFGSAARGEETIKSDIDLLIDFDQPKSLFDLAKVKLSIQDTLGKNVDLTLRGSIKKMLKPYIENDLIAIYEKN